jgi:hypothetical protein
MGLTARNDPLADGGGTEAGHRRRARQLEDRPIAPGNGSGSPPPWDLDRSGGLWLHGSRGIPAPCCLEPAEGQLKCPSPAEAVAPPGSRGRRGAAARKALRDPHLRGFARATRLNARRAPARARVRPPGGAAAGRRPGKPGGARDGPSGVKPARPAAAAEGRSAAKPAGARDGPAGLKLEAAGVEPASRDVSIRTSTCVSGQLESRPRVPGRQGSSQTSPELF